MAETLTKAATIVWAKGKPSLSFLYASFGPQVIEQLREDETFAANFPDDIATLVTGGEGLTPTAAARVMDAFLDCACGAYKTKTHIASWVLNQYLSHRHNDRPMLAEDLYKMKEAIAYFEALKKSDVLQIGGGNPDLTQHSYDSLQETLRPFEQKKARKAQTQRERHMSDDNRAQLMAETTVLYDGPLGKVVVPHTWQASQYWGNNTKWCISSKSKGDADFRIHNSISPILILIPQGQEDNKVALVGGVFYNSQDKRMGRLPSEHQKLLDQCLSALKPNTRARIRGWIPKDMPGEWDEYLNTVFREAPVKWDVPGTLWNNKEFVLLALEHDWRTERYISSDLKKDKKVAQTIHRISQTERMMRIFGTQSKCNMALRLDFFENSIKKGKLRDFQWQARHFKCTWGNPDTLFSCDPTEILPLIKDEITTAVTQRFQSTAFNPTA